MTELVSSREAWRRVDFRGGNPEEVVGIGDRPGRTMTGNGPGSESRRRVKWNIFSRRARMDNTCLLIVCLWSN